MSALVLDPKLRRLVSNLSRLAYLGIVTVVVFVTAGIYAEYQNRHQQPSSTPAPDLQPAHNLQHPTSADELNAKDAELNRLIGEYQKLIEAEKKAAQTK